MEQALGIVFYLNNTICEYEDISSQFPTMQLWSPASRTKLPVRISLPGKGERRQVSITEDRAYVAHNK